MRDLVFCFGPLAGGAEDCTADGRLCRRVRDGVRCVLGPGPDPRCESGTQQYCDGDLGVLCAGDFRLETMRCDEEERCVETEPGVRVRCE